ncbi:MAG TPA: nucleotidyl transferase AbiEii/AbiGii toxin family protein [Blastocatellia bacterium]|nr:nucleotidyl transferase AbiEii/AbiGii toxin family protein [Blastocatellia bacterium]
MTRKKLPEKMAAALQSLSAWLSAEQVPHTTIGGVAVSLLAQPRTTEDIDAVIWLEMERWESFLSSGEKYGIVPRISDPLDFARNSRVLLLQHQPTGIGIDLSCGALPFEQEMIERAVSIRIGGLTLHLPTPEDLVITKAVAQRPQDLADIDSIVRTTPVLDHERIRHWVSQFAEALEMPEIAESIEARLQKSKPARPAQRKKMTRKPKK